MFFNASISGGAGQTGYCQIAQRISFMVYPKRKELITKILPHSVGHKATLAEEASFSFFFFFLLINNFPQLSSNFTHLFKNLLSSDYTPLNCVLYEIHNGRRALLSDDVGNEQNFRTYHLQNENHTPAL